jgi:hypothetical protein
LKGRFLAGFMPIVALGLHWQCPLKCSENHEWIVHTDWCLCPRGLLRIGHCHSICTGNH